VKSDIVISSTKAVDVMIELQPTSYSTENIDVQASYFQKSSDVNLSMTNFDYEEIRRAPGASEDISRMLQTAPGVSIVNDQRNDLVVRGGSPSENLIMIDGVEIPNINHYGTQGSTGGPISFINLKFIREADIYTGGFISKYGDKLSSVVDIKFREGSSTNYINNIDLSFAGFGGVFEGPITSKSSYLFSIRRSYLDLLKGSIRLSAVPNYWDFNLKLNYNIDQNNSLSLIGFSALDKIEFKYDDASSVDDFPYNTVDNTNTYTGGLVYKKLFKSGYMQSVVSNTYTDYYIYGTYAPTGKEQYSLNSYENEFTYKTDFNFKLTKSSILNFGLGGKYGNFRNEMFSASDTTPVGYVIPELRTDSKIITTKLYSNVNLTQKFFDEKVILNAGARIDYFDYINLKTTFSPRFGLSYKVTPLTSINASYGIFNQSPAYIWLATSDMNRNLSSIRSDHYILGIEQTITPAIMLIAEVYEKRYSNYPVSIDDPRYILVDGGADYGPNLVGAAASVGYGYVRGFDFSIQKKLSGNGLYGTLNYSYSKSGFTALEGGEKPAAFDPTHQFTIIAGYQVADDWLIGLKFKYAGGRPYTPYDINASVNAGRGVWDMNNFNGERYPAYHRLDLRVDKKFYFKKASITGYLELQNVYNQQNIYGYFWNQAKNEVGTIYHWAFMPVGGFSMQF
jgi:outer membrane cobalamin receptor